MSIPLGTPVFGRERRPRNQSVAAALLILLNFLQEDFGIIPNGRNRAFPFTYIFGTDSTVLSGSSAIRKLASVCENDEPYTVPHRSEGQ
jgi:hypothetical protein